MQALRLARPRASLCRPLAVRRSLATTANPSHVAASATTTTTSSTSSSSATKSPSIIPLSNVEAQWERLSKDEQVAVHAQLETLQKKDWKALSLDEKKAAYYVAFGPHGPRAPLSPPGENFKIFLATMGLVGVASLLFLGFRALAPPPPKTISKEWEEAANQRALDQKMNPISGISSEGYKGKGFVTHK